MAVRVAQGLVIASLVLLIIYGADSSVKRGQEAGFLPIDAMTRGIGLGGTAVALSTASFFVAMREKSYLVSVLLIVNGILVIIGGVMASMADPKASPAGAYSVIGMGVWVLALGIVKSIRKRRTA